MRLMPLQEFGGTTHVDEAKEDAESAWTSNNTATYQVKRMDVPSFNTKLFLVFDIPRSTPDNGMSST